MGQANGTRCATSKLAKAIEIKGVFRGPHKGCPRCPRCPTAWDRQSGTHSLVRDNERRPGAPRLALDAGDGVGAPWPTDAAFYVSIVGAVVSAISAGVAIISALVASRAKEQAKNVALFDRRTKAIELVRHSCTAITGNRFVSDPDLLRLVEAKNLCELIFGSEMQEAITEACSKARDLAERSLERKERQFQDALDGLGKELQTLHDQMQQQTKLG
jgi:hypothetical protein